MIRGLEDGGDDDRRGGTRTTGVNGGSESVTAREKMTRQRGLRNSLVLVDHEQRRRGAL